jgi:signal transduction histidine kinase
MILKENLTSLGRLASGVAHEFGNPLTTISSIAQLLRRRRKDDEFVTEQAGIIEAHVKRLSRVARQLVDLAFPKRPEITVFDVNRALDDTLLVARLDPRLKDVDLELDRAEGELRVTADEGGTHLVLLNLLFNAADAMEGSGALRISTRLSDLGVEVRVADTGPGIPEEIRSRVFAPFFTTKEAGAGTGLGLSISCRLARAMGGELNLVRSGPAGSCFLLLLNHAEEAA